MVMTSPSASSANVTFNGRLVLILVFKSFGGYSIVGGVGGIFLIVNTVSFCFLFPAVSFTNELTLMTHPLVHATVKFWANLAVLASPNVKLKYLFIPVSFITICAMLMPTSSVAL